MICFPFMMGGSEVELMEGSFPTFLSIIPYILKKLDAKQPRKRDKSYSLFHLLPYTDTQDK